MKLKIGTTLSTLFCLLTTIGMAQDKFTITGNLSQSGSNKMVFLSYVNSEGKTAKDSALVTNGKFKITGTTAFGNRSFLELKPVPKDEFKTGGTSDRKEFYLERGNTIVVGKNNISTALISGTEVQKEYIDYHTQMDPIEKKYEQIAARYEKASSEKDSLELKKIALDGGPVVAKMNLVRDNFITRHPDSYFTADLVLLNTMIFKKGPELEAVYKSLGSRLLNSFTGKKITDQFNKANLSDIGKTIDFSLPDKDGNEFKLSSLKGKYVLVDIWASWCVPCRAENPFMLKAYMELKDKNFEIVGISLDDKRTAWLNAVEQDKLPWTQVSDLKGYNTEIAVRLGIHLIPQNVLIDPDGKIIAKDLRGENLNKMIASYIK